MIVILRPLVLDILDSNLTKSGLNAKVHLTRAYGWAVMDANAINEINRNLTFSFGKSAVEIHALKKQLEELNEKLGEHKKKMEMDKVTITNGIINSVLKAIHKVGI